MATELKMTLLLRRGEFSDSYVLQAGEPGYHTGTKVLKIGDGATTWDKLGFANQAQIEALIKAVDDKVAALNDTYATDAEVEAVRAALDAAKLDKTIYETYIATHALTDEQINTAIGNVDAKFADYRTSTAQDAIDNAIKGRLDTLEAKPFDTYATKTEVQQVATDLSEYEVDNDNRVEAIEKEIDTFGDIVTHNAAEFETNGAAAAAEGRINETLKNYYTKTEADTEFATPDEVIAEVNRALADVSGEDTIENITTLVSYVNENAADLTGLITEVYGNAEMTGDSRLDTIEAKAAMGITADDISAWNAEKGVKAIVDANKATWDKAGTALQAADLADYAKTADVVTNDEFTTFEATNTEAIGKKLDKTVFDAFNNGTSKDVAAIEADIVTKANAAQAAAEAKAAELDNALHTTISGEVDTAKQEAIDAAATDATTKANKALEDAKAYADAKEHKNTTYSVAATENALEFTVTPSEGDAQTVKLVAPVVDTGVMSVAAGTTNAVITVSTTDGAVTVAHKDYDTGTVKDAAHDSADDPSFITGISIENGHVTGATVRNLSEVLEAMEFVLDCGSVQ
jgi:hypothetical protein